ncbi:hypothetical protein GGQ85_004390 [Nitrobacter vulgaris]|nr:hypothetical protein [Nitrobacter vulgaris]
MLRLIWLKLTFSDSEVAGNRAIGHGARGHELKTPAAGSLNIERGRKKRSPNRSTVRARVAETVPYGIHLSYTGMRSGTGERVSPSLFPRAVPSIRIGTIEPVSVIPTFNYRTLINKGPERPAMQSAKSRAGAMCNRR